MLEEKDQQIVRTLVDGIPFVPRPYAALAEKAGMEEEEFLARMKKLKAQGILRRVGAVLQHRRAGFAANALCVWSVPKDRLDEVGIAVSSETTVSHCYSRETAPGWPYNLYAMIHAQSRDACEEIADRISAKNDLGDRQTFYSVREWKKAAMRYFCEKHEEFV